MGLQWVLDGAFGVDRLTRVAQEAPSPGPGEVRIRVTAVSLNYRDILMVGGQYNARQPLPLVPGSDCVGVVDAVGEGVPVAMLGQRRVVAFNPGWRSGRLPANPTRTTLGGPVQGVFRSFVVVSADAVVAPPAHFSDAEAACLPCAGVTAYRAVVVEAGIGAGDTVLTLGTGGVSLFALQIAKMVGAHVCVTSASDEKRARATALGADHTISYVADAAWGRSAARWAGSGVDAVVELGGAGTLAQSLQAVRAGGTVSLIGVLAGVQTELALTSILMRHIRVQGVLVGAVADLADLCDLYAAHPSVRPVVDRVFPFADLPDAMRHLASGSHFGKVVMMVD